MKVSVCDFCGDVPTKALVSASFMLPRISRFVQGHALGDVPIRSETDWLACGGCAGLVAEQDYSTLTNRATDHHVANGTLAEKYRAQFRLYLSASYDRLRRHLSGEVVPLDEYQASR